MPFVPQEYAEKDVGLAGADCDPSNWRLARVGPWYVPAVLVMALSTGHKVGLALAVAGFAGFSLVVSMLVPRWYPQFPGRGLPVFLVTIVLLFIGMMSAVIVFGRESGEAAAAATKVNVTEIDYKIQLPKTTFSPGTYTFVVQNRGKVPHNLTITGPGVNAATPTFGSQSTAQVTVDLKPGKYDFFCSVPGHKQLGMNVNVTVSGGASSAGTATISTQTTATTATSTQATATTTTGTNTTQTATQPAPSATAAVKVTEVDFKIQLPKTSFKAGPVTFDVTNTGKVPHDLVVKGNGVNAKTPLLNPGQSKTLKVDLKPGTYELYCSVPGHKQLGMDEHITVS